jgi:hypothetical protein
MSRPSAELARLLQRLSDEPGGLVPCGSGYGLAAEGKARLSARMARLLLAQGLLREEGGRLQATDAVSSWLKRRDASDMPYRAQHHALDSAPAGQAGPGALVNLDESPLATLARRAGASGAPWLGSHEVEAAERLRRDFEVGRLQPRITANWSASVNAGRRAEGAGLADLTDMALAARLRFGAAMEAVGPELSGVLVDVCCFLTGLERVERERQWPARSAKLVLRLGLQALARHYGLAAAVTGASGAKLRRWGAQDYRPRIS